MELDVVGLGMEAGDGRRGVDGFPVSAVGPLLVDLLAGEFLLDDRVAPLDVADEQADRVEIGVAGRSVARAARRSIEELDQRVRFFRERLDGLGEGVVELAREAVGQPGGILGEVGQDLVPNQQGGADATGAATAPW